jgi:hypothetical protein
LTAGIGIAPAHLELSVFNKSGSPVTGLFAQFKAGIDL